MKMWAKTKPVLKPLFLWLLGLAYLIGLFVGVTSMLSQLPAPRPVDSVGFSETRAMRTMDRLVKTIGARPIDSWQNRNDTLRFLMDQLKYLQGNASSLGLTKVEFNLQNETDHCLETNFPRPNLVCFDTMNNIIVRLIPKRSNASFTPSRNVILLSAHYDTVPLSPGVYDDTTGVVTLLELLHDADIDIVAVFNNGEETGLWGSTVFITSEEYRQVRGFINMDCRPGRKSMLFQSTGGWMNPFLYSMPRPFASVVGQDLFRSGLIHSGTDFEVYARNATGLDFAFFEFPQRYHTMADTLDHYFPGSVQFLGDNVLGILTAVLDTKQLNFKPQFNQRQVFFDIVNLVYISFSMDFSFIFHCFVLAFLILMIAIAIFWSIRVWRTLPDKGSIPHPGWYIGIHATVLVLALLISIGFNGMVGMLLHKVNPNCLYTVTNAHLIFPASSIFIYCLILYCSTYITIKCGQQEAPETIDNFFMEGQEIIDLSENRVSLVQGVRISFLHMYHYSFLISAIFWAVLMFASMPLAYSLGSTYLIMFPGVFYLGALCLQMAFYYFQTSQVELEEVEVEETDEESGMLFHKQVTTMSTFRTIRFSWNASMFKMLNSVNSPSEFDLVQTKVKQERSLNYFIGWSWSILLFVITTLPLILFVQIGYFFLTNSIEIPYFAIGALFSLIVLLLLVTFYPISSYFNIYGTMSIVFGLIFLIMFCIVATAFPFSASMPWVGRASQTVRPAINESFVTFAAQDVKNQSVKEFLESFVNGDVNCVPVGRLARVSCQYNATLPNVIVPEVYWSRSHDLVENLQSGMYEYYNFTINITAPGAFIHKINISTRGNFETIMYIKGSTGFEIDLPKNEFTLSLSTDAMYSLHLRIHFPPHLRNETNCIVHMQLATSYDSTGVSPSIDRLIRHLPPYGIIEGTSSQPVVQSLYEHSEC